MLLYVLLNLVSGESLGIESTALRHGISAHEGFIAIEQIEARAVDPEIAAKVDVVWIYAARKRLIKLKRVGINLAPVNIIEVAARVHQLRNHLLFAHGQCG